MIPPFVFGALAFAVCACTLPIAKRAAAYWGLYDHPGELKVHREPIPRVGGMAMMVGVCAVLVPATLPFLAKYGLCLVAISSIWVVGLIDDVRSLSPLIRLGVQLAAGALLWIGGWRLHWTTSAVPDLLMTSLFVAFLISAMNLFDGLDGLAAGTTAIAATGFLWLPLDPISKVVACSLIGVCLGVLLVNFPPAKMFMGDSGSTLIGVLLAFLSLDWIRTQPDSHNIVPPLIFICLPVADTLLAILRRLRSHQSPFCADRRHFYDLLLQRGWSVRGVLLVSMGTTSALVAIGGFSLAGQRASQIAIVVVVASLAFVAHVLGSLRPNAVKGHAQQQIASLNSIAE